MKRYTLAGRFVLAGALATALVACGDSDSDGDSGTQVTEPPGEGNTDEGGPQTPSTPVTEVPYQTGYVLSSIRGEVVGSGFSPPAIDFDTDEQANEISDGITANVYPDLAYDDLGRATTIDYEFGVPVTLAYNDDGTLSRVEQGMSFSEYEYDDGVLAVRRSGRTENGETTIGRRFEYGYSTDGSIESAELFSGDSSDPLRTYRYVTDGEGRITEIAEISASGSQGIRLVLAYDEFSNITRLERFGSDGSLQIVTTYAYTPSPEPVVNVISLFSALSGTYIPSPDSVEYF